MATDGNSVVDQSTRYSKFEGLNPATAENGNEIIPKMSMTDSKALPYRFIKLGAIFFINLLALFHKTKRKRTRMDSWLKFSGLKFWALRQILIHLIQVKLLLMALLIIYFTYK